MFLLPPGLRTLFLCSLLLFTAPAFTHPLPRAHFSTTTVNTLSHGGSRHQKYTAGIISIHFDQDVSIVRDAKRSSSFLLSEVDEYPEVVDTLYGLLQFRCHSASGATKDLVLSLDQRVPPQTTTLPTGILFPMQEIAQHQVPWLTSIIARTHLDADQFAHMGRALPSGSRYDLVYLWQDEHATHLSAPSVGQHQPHHNLRHPEHILSRVQRGDCNVHFLNQTEQTWMPKGSLVSDNKDGTTSSTIVESVAVEHWDGEMGKHRSGRSEQLDSDDDTEKNGWPKSVLSTATAIKSNNMIADAVSKVAAMSSSSQHQELHTIEQARTTTGAAPPLDCIPLPAGLANYAKDKVLLETTSTTHTKQKGIAQDIPKIIKEPVGDILKPIMKLMGGFLGETLVEPLKEQMGQLTSAGMTSQTVEDLSSALINSLSQGIPATTLNTIPYVVIEGLAESLMLYVTEQVTNELVDPLASKLSASLGVSVTAKVKDETPRKLARHVTKSLIHSLTRSVSHSVVPSLVHTLTHSPLQDYYCYYCYHHKTYCQYCQYSPSQLYYALYYTGFYST